LEPTCERLAALRRGDRRHVSCQDVIALVAAVSVDVLPPLAELGALIAGLGRAPLDGQFVEFVADDPHRVRVLRFLLLRGRARVGVRGCFLLWCWGGFERITGGVRRSGAVAGGFFGFELARSGEK